MEQMEQIEQTEERTYVLPASILIATVMISATWFYVEKKKNTKPNESNAPIAQTVGDMPGEIPNLSPEIITKLYDLGVIDKTKVQAELSTLNLLWAFGLANKNPILEQGPMTGSSEAGLSAEALAKAGGFASTGGWTLSVGDPMSHYSKHALVVLTSAQQELVERVSKNIYRPCCNNSTYFPDCNHGMAMLGLLELMASQGADELSMYRAALKANTLWFPNQYATIDRYLVARGSSLANANPQEILGRTYSSGSGFAQIAAAAPAEPASNRPPSGGCSV